MGPIRCYILATTESVYSVYSTYENNSWISYGDRKEILFGSWQHDDIACPTKEGKYCPMSLPIYTSFISANCQILKRRDPNESHHLEGCLTARLETLKQIQQTVVLLVVWVWECVHVTKTMGPAGESSCTLPLPTAGEGPQKVGVVEERFPG